MISPDIDKFLHKHYRTRHVYRGCFAADEIADEWKRLTTHSVHSRQLYPSSFVVNTDERAHPGTHWVAIYVCSPTSVEYFDSLAEEPNKYFVDFLSAFKNVKKSEKPVQHPLTNVCGQFCIFFIISRCSGLSFLNVQKFLFKKSNPDLFVKNFTSLLL